MQAHDPEHVPADYDFLWLYDHTLYYRTLPDDGARVFAIALDEIDEIIYSAALGDPLAPLIAACVRTRIPDGSEPYEPSDDEADAIEQWQDACDKSPPRLRVVRDGE